MNAKLSTLLKTREAAEEEAIRLLQHVAQVTEARRLIVEEIRKRRVELEEQHLGYTGARRMQALCVGRVQDVCSATSYAKRIQRSIKRLEGELAEREQELSQAVVRLAAAEEELTEARVERKKIESLIAKRDASERIQAHARDEAIADELNILRRGGGG